MATSAAAAPANALLGVARALVQGDLIDEKKAHEIQSKANSDKIGFLEALTRDNRTHGRRASEILAKLFDMPLMDLDAIEPEIMPAGDVADLKKVEEISSVEPLDEV